MSKGESVETNKDIARRFVAAIPVTDATQTAVRSTMAADAVWEFVLAGGYRPELKAFTGPTRWNREEMIRMQVTFSDQLREPYKLKLTSLVAEGDHVVAEAVGHGVSVGTGRSYEQRYCFHLTLRDGLIVAGRVYQDTLHLWEIWMYSAAEDFFLKPLSQSK
jgi:ketosteroid isomerase-like protein